MKMYFLMIAAILIFSGASYKSQEARILEGDFTIVETLSDFKTYITKDNVKIRLKSGNYQINDAESIRFLQFTGNNSHFDLTDCRSCFPSKSSLKIINIYISTTTLSIY